MASVQQPAAAPPGSPIPQHPQQQNPSNAPHQPPPPARPPAPYHAAPAQRPTTVCGRCRGVNPSGMQFCQFCGASLGVEAAAGSVAPGARSPEAHAHHPVAAQVPGDVARHGGGGGGGGGGVLRARLIVITQDGTPGRTYEIAEGQADVGRDEGSILLSNDPYVSPRHARIRQQNGQFFVRDLGSINGVYLRLRRSEKLEHGDLLLLGLEVLRFEVVNDAEKSFGAAVDRGVQVFGSPATVRHGRLCQRTVEGITRDVYSLYRDETVIGRESGDLVFTSDPFMSRQHAAINRDPYDGSFAVRDLGSSNGTYLAIRGEVAIQRGDHVRIGQHLFRLEVDSE